MTDPFDLNNFHEVINAPFPAATKQAAGVINGVKIDVMTISFADKILVTISQKGRLAHWLHVPLENLNPGTEGSHTISDADDDSLLPMASLTATSILGGHAAGHDTVGQLYARQIASAIAMKSPNEKRLLVVGLGLDSAEPDRDVFFAIVDLVLQCI
ncbi:hypothetical protein AOR_1_208114 [Paecilomyces variotii No. 5]|uniref:Uncharacterized protein n=1 Tax=Byssochlamys spectabilis (strain No. 5 / NBRC 109023) TaxID=1356009 RepID=V5F6Y0_BYSSN|nr:hypothetical protein AOR_1_208114 [Paecilomyces variotii No. 5]